MREIKLRVVPKPDPNYTTIIEGSSQLGDQPYMKGEGAGTRRYVCGNCNHILLDNLSDSATITNVIFKCTKCEAYNEI